MKGVNSDDLFWKIEVYEVYETMKAPYENTNAHASGPTSALILSINVPNVSVRWRIWDGLATFWA